MQEKKKIYFVCSSSLHVKLLSRTLKKLSCLGGFDPYVVSLDNYNKDYFGDVSSCIENSHINVNVISVNFHKKLLKIISLRKIYNVLRCRFVGVGIFNKLFEEGTPSLIVFGNDTGHCERAAIHAARNLNIKTLLVQDGYIASFPDKLWGRLKRRLTDIWLNCGGDKLGFVPYGMAGCDFIASYGPRWAGLFTARKRHWTNDVLVVGHPALTGDFQDEINVENKSVVYFCTNFISAYKDQTAHKKQIMEIKCLKDLMASKYECDKFYVKIHPADNLCDYDELAKIPGIELVDNFDLAELIQSSWLCFTNISSVSIDCLLNARLCLMSGISLSENYINTFLTLPGVKLTTWDELDSQLELLCSADKYAEIYRQQVVKVSSWIDIDKNHSGASRLAHLIYDLSA